MRFFASRSRTADDRVLVVADNCDDHTAELARRAGAEVFVRIDPDHRGKGYAMQFGLQALRANPPDVIVVIDADCLTETDAIDTLARVRLAHAEAGAVAKPYRSQSRRGAYPGRVAVGQPFHQLDSTAGTPPTRGAVPLDGHRHGHPLAAGR